MVRLSIIFLLVMTYCHGQNYFLKTQILNEGGQKITSNGYIVNLSFGQPIAYGKLTNSNYRAYLGFLRVPNNDRGVYPGIEQNEIQIQSDISNFNLIQCFPNPFRNQTMIKYNLPIETNVNLNVYNNAGQIVGTLVNGKQQPGQYNITWNINNVSQTTLPNGVYFYRLETNEYSATKKLVITR